MSEHTHAPWRPCLICTWWGRSRQWASEEQSWCQKHERWTSIWQLTVGAVQRCRGPRQNRKFLKKVKGMRDEHQDDIDSGRMLIGMLWNEQWRVKAKKLHWLFSREFYVSSEIYQILLSLTKSEFAAPEGRRVSSRRRRPWWSHILRG